MEKNIIKNELFAVSSSDLRVGAVLYHPNRANDYGHTKIQITQVWFANIANDTDMVEFEYLEGVDEGIYDTSPTWILKRTRIESDPV